MAAFIKSHRVAQLLPATQSDPETVAYKRPVQLLQTHSANMAGIFEVDGKQMSSFHSAVLFHMPKPSYMNTGVSELEFNVPFQHKHG